MRLGVLFVLTLRFRCVQLSRVQNADFSDGETPLKSIEPLYL